MSFGALKRAALILSALTAPATTGLAQLPVPIVSVSCERVGANPCAPPRDSACVALDPAVGAGCLAEPARLAPATPAAAAPAAGTITELRDWQVAYFRRGTAALVVAAFDVSRDKLFWEFLAGWGTVPLGGPSPEPWSAGLFAPTAPSLDGDSSSPISAVVQGPPRAKWITAIAASWDSLPLALDLVAPADPSAPIPVVRLGAIGRARLTAHPPPQPSQRVQLSDILLYEPDDRDAPRTLDDKMGALPRALGTTTLGGRQRIGLYWETYGLEDGDPTAIELTALPVLDPAKEDARKPVGVSWKMDAPWGVTEGCRTASCWT